MKKIILTVAPTGGWGLAYENPLIPDVLAEDLINCIKEGASVVHLHARDNEGNLTTDLANFNSSINLVKQSCDFILEASTGGLSDLSAQERALPVKSIHAELGSLNIGSLNFGDEVYNNSLLQVRSWIKTMDKYKVKPSLEIFDTGHLEAALALIDEGLISLPCNFSFIFDVKWGMPFHPDLLSYLISRLPERSRWSALLINSLDFSNHIHAARAGASALRTGFEDSRFYNGNTANTNAELVKALREELEKEGFAIATTAEARKMLMSV